MLEALIERILDGSLMPHGVCLLWRSDLIFLHLAGDILTTLAYFTIPAALVYLVRHRQDLAFDHIFVMFALFIFLCGVTHMLSVVNLWHGFYFIEGVAKLATGLISAATAIMAWRMLPRAVAIPGHTALRGKIAALEAAERELARANEHLEARVRSRTRQLEQLARTDELTGLNNRREMMQRLQEELMRAKRHGTSLSVMMVDLDHFKAINDEFGHPVGDLALAGFARRAMHVVRDTDCLGRYGGEEFLVLAPNTDHAGALELAERLRAATDAEPLVSGDTSLHLTCSIGIARSQGHESIESLLHRADGALYEAKEGGRNRVVAASEQSG